MDIHSWLQNTADRHPPDEEDHPGFPAFLNAVNNTRARPFSASAATRRIQRPISAEPTLTPYHPDHEKDNDELRSLFDAPPSSTSANNLRSSGPSTGLFEIPSLTSPQNFLILAQQTLARAQLLVDRIDRAGSSDASTPEGAKELREVVRNLDRLSDLLCGVIDMAELVRNAHPNPEWSEAANAVYEYLCGYIHREMAAVARVWEGAG